MANHTEDPLPPRSEAEMNDAAVGVKVYLTEELNAALNDSRGFDPSNARATSVRRAIKLLEKLWKGL